MAQRTLDSSFWDDEDIASLSFGERLLFICMFTDASLSDDYGRLLANPKTLKKHAFGYDDDVTTDQVRQWRNSILSKCRNVVLYEIEGQEYIYLRKFQQYQKLRFQRKSNIPEPTQESIVNNSVPLQEITGNCGNLPKSDAKFPLCSVALNSVEQDSVGLACAEPPQVIEKPPRQSTRVREPYPNNPAIQAFQDVFKCRPKNRDQAAIITDTIRPTELQKWKEVMQAWNLRAYNPQNVPGMLGWYRDGIPTNGNGKPHARAGPPEYPHMDIQEVGRLNDIAGELPE